MPIDEDADEIKSYNDIGSHFGKDWPYMTHIRDAKCKLSNMIAGVCIVFYTPHCLLSRTDRPLTFCYDKEGEHIFPQITEHTGRNRECVTMFNDC